MSCHGHVTEPPLLCTNSEGVYGNKSGYCSLHRDTLGCIATLTNHWLHARLHLIRPHFIPFDIQAKCAILPNTMPIKTRHLNIHVCVLHSSGLRAGP